MIGANHKVAPPGNRRKATPARDFAPLTSVKDVKLETPASGTKGNGMALPMINDNDFELF